MATEKRLIDANDAIERLKVSNQIVRSSIWETDEVVELLEDCPTVDAVEVVHGEWRYYSTTMQECSNCHRHTARHKFKYCPHCGAVMEDKYYESTD